jgi:TolA-binding protein
LEHEEQADQLDAEARQMEGRVEELDKQLQSSRQDWDQKKNDSQVEGAQTPPGTSFEEALKQDEEGGDDESGGAGGDGRPESDDDSRSADETKAEGESRAQGGSGSEDGDDSDKE